MGRGFQRNGTSRSSSTDGPPPIVCGQQGSCLLSKQRHNLSMFCSLVKQRFVNSTLFNFAGTFLKRMKQYFHTGWKLQEYVPRMRRLSQVLDFNANANTHKKPNKTRSVGRPRRTVTAPVAKPKHKQNDKPKRDRCLRSDVISKGSKKTPRSVKKSTPSSTGDDVVQPTCSQTDDQLSVGTHHETTNLHEEHQSQQIKLSACSNFGEVSTSENGHSSSLAENIPVLDVIESDLNNWSEQQTKPKKSTRLRPKSPPNVKDLNPKKDVRVDRLEMKSLSLQQISKGIRPKLESKNCVASLHSEVWQSNTSFNSNPKTSNDWPSLDELGRRRSLFKAAKEIVRRKYAGSGILDAGSGVSDAGSGVSDAGSGVSDAGSGVWDAGSGVLDTGSGVKGAGRLLKDVIYVDSEQSDVGVDETVSFSRTVQQTCVSTASQRTWASVAAQSLTGTVSDQTPSETCQTPMWETTENNPACSSFSNVSILKIRKPPIRSKLASSNRLSGDHSKISEKPTLGKFMAERQESAKLQKTIRGKNKLSKHAGQKDQSDKRRSRKVERYDKTLKSIAHQLDTQTSNSCWDNSWVVDEMPVVYSCTPFSECNNNRASQLAAGSCNSKSSFSIATDGTMATIDVDGGMCTNTSLLSDNVQSDSVDGQHDEVIVTSSSRCSSLEIKTEISLPVETEAKSPKKVSVRYRALLRNDSSYLTAKTLTEMQTRNKKTNNLHDNKLATRERQRQQRQERQTTHHDALRFHTSTCPVDTNQSCQSGPEQITCSYWLRSMPASRAFGYIDTFESVQSNSENHQKDGSSGVSNKVKVTQLQPCRRSERLRDKAKNAKSAYSSRCLCKDGTGN